MKLEIKTESYQPFDFSEYYLVKLPVFTFNIHVYTIGEPLTDFSIELIVETIKNLVIARRLELSYNCTDKSDRANGAKITWFIENLTTDLNHFSWLEQQILSVAPHSRRKPLNEFIHAVLCHFDKIFNYLGRYILYKVATENKSGLITTSISKRFLSKRLSITLNEAVSLAGFIKTEGQIGIESVENEKFKFFSDTLFSKLRRQFINYKND